MPAISVIVPVYKVEAYLDTCVESILAQTFTDLEVILVDDGSPDGCPAKCDAWAQKDPRVRVIHQANGGLSAARNTGIEAATGDFFAFVDSDDLLEPDTLRRAWGAQQQSGADLVIFNLYFADEDGQPMPEPDFTIFREETLTPDQFWDRYYATIGPCRNYYEISCNKLYKRELFRTLRYRLNKRFEDAFLLPALIDQCKMIACLSYQGYIYIQRKGSIMSQGSSLNYLDRSEYQLERCDYFAAKGNFRRAEGLLNETIRNLSEKYRFDLSTPAQRRRYRKDCRACAAAYQKMARQTGSRSMQFRAWLLYLGLTPYRLFLQTRTQDWQ